MYDDMLITGITSLDCYPKLRCAELCRQIVETDSLCILDVKPDIESINEVKVNVEVECFKIINSILGPKILVSGVKKIKVIYTACNLEQSVHSAHWCVPFCDFILLKGLSYEKCCNLINKIFVGVEHVCIRTHEKRRVDVSILLILCPVVKCDNFDPCRC